LFLSKAEWDYLTSKRQFDDDYSYTIKSRLVKKIDQFANQELPLLIEKGYLTEFCKLTDNCKVCNDLVAQPGRARRLSFGNTKNNEIKSPRRDLNARPKVSASPLVISTTRARDYETFALPG
jgi:hypothetical protein